MNRDGTRNVIAATSVPDARLIMASTSNVYTAAGNIADESPLSIYEIAQLIGEPYPSSAEPLDDPWQGQVDAALARSLGFRAAVPSVYAAARDGRL